MQRPRPRSSRGRRRQGGARGRAGFPQPRRSQTCHPLRGELGPRRRRRTLRLNPHPAMPWAPLFPGACALGGACPAVFVVRSTEVLMFVAYCRSAHVCGLRRPNPPRRAGVGGQSPPSPQLALSCCSLTSLVSQSVLFWLAGHPLRPRLLSVDTKHTLLRRRVPPPHQRKHPRLLFFFFSSLSPPLTLAFSLCLSFSPLSL